MGSSVFIIFLGRLAEGFKLLFLLMLKDSIRTEEGIVKLNGPVRLRLFLEEMGGAFIKFGRMLVLYHDLLPFEYIKELHKIKNRVHPVPLAEMKKIFLEETGRRVESFFSGFDSVPVASTVTGQIYKARLQNGELVAVKIQRPYIDMVFKADSMVLSVLVGILNFFGILSSVRAQELLHNFVKWSYRSLDFLYEARNAEVQYRHRSEHPETLIPKQYLEFSTQKVLIHEFVEQGVSVEDLINKTLQSENMFLSETSRGNALNFVIADEMRQYFIDGFFHADPHPGNLFFIGDSNLVHLDFWIVENAERKNTNFLKALYGIAQKDSELFAENFFDLGKEILREDVRVYLKMDLSSRTKLEAVVEKIREAIVADYKKEVCVILGEWFAKLDDEKTISEERRASDVFMRIIKISENFGVYLSRENNMFLRALLALDSAGVQVSPNFNLPTALSHFFNKCSLEEVSSILERGFHLQGVEDEIISATDIDWELFKEIAAEERQKMNVAKEKTMELIEYYADHYESIRSMLKNLS